MILYRAVKIPDGSPILQENLNHLYLRTLTNKLELNIEKQQLMSFYRVASYIDYSYKIGDGYLMRVDSYSELSVLLNTKLTFSQYILITVTEAFDLLGFLIRNTKPFSEGLVLIHFYSTFIRTKLEYCATDWNPNYNKYVHQLESVQISHDSLLP